MQTKTKNWNKLKDGMYYDQSIFKNQNNQNISKIPNKHNDLQEKNLEKQTEYNLDNAMVKPRCQYKRKQCTG